MSEPLLREVPTLPQYTPLHLEPRAVHVSDAVKHGVAEPLLQEVARQPARVLGLGRRLLHRLDGDAVKHLGGRKEEEVWDRRQTKSWRGYLQCIPTVAFLALSVVTDNTAGLPSPLQWAYTLSFLTL